ncbi:Serine/threonine-protein kinase PknA [Planctomycetes bacterium CA13]|uniref:Serine/threonine-protein kinase PknA n=1 Tax=Novipirellula herctigrandis TaxID=2527986 RepID=A0A5C5Z9M5_9BACT|nr:Serine/threonine-protein kinase PknA [Planctomycetes bacterium CA13]
MGDISASELARLDAVCLEYETALRRGEEVSISDIVAEHGGESSHWLRRELEAVRGEIIEGNPISGHETLFASERNTSMPKLPSEGSQIGPYRVERLLDRGGMGVVYSAIDSRLGRKVAIKMMAIDGEKHGSLRDRFQREARAVAAISHPNVVELFDVGLFGSSPYAVMEFLDGETLDRLLRRTRLSIDEIRSIGAQIADALSVAHAAGVVHRDLKPHNIMVMRRSADPLSSSISGESLSAGGALIKLFDFGLSRSDGIRFGNGEHGDDGERTREGVVMGTPGYMAPEQARGEQAGPMADLFSLGCILYEAFYGKRAFDGDTATQRFASTLEQTPDFDPERSREDRELSKVIGKCLQRKPEARPASANLVSEALLKRPSSTAPSDLAPEAFRVGRRRMMELTGGGVVGLLLAAYAQSTKSESLGAIDSLGVLSFIDVRDASATLADGAKGDPVGDREIFRGDQLAALLVNELSRMPDINVTPFRPIVANTRSEYQRIGDELDVDALVTGTFQTIRRGNKTFDEINLQIVSARTGNQLWGGLFSSELGESLLEQSRFASEIATKVGRSLTSSADELKPQSVSAFRCLVDGSARSDPDSPDGLRKALLCYKSAHSQDEQFAAPLAGLGLTSITLAAQSAPKESIKLIQQARESVDDALSLDLSSVDARLAEAMIKWQTQYQYTEATEILSALAEDVPNHWQVRHQFGLLELTKGNIGLALQMLREATQLNPLSVVAKVDLARAYWFSGNTDRAITDAKRVRSRHSESLYARGLLIDLYEDEGNVHLAAVEHDGVDFGDSLTESLTADSYFAKRSELDLEQYPYGPYGTLLNRAMLQSRMGEPIGDAVLGELADPTPPMLPLLLATHPCFAEARKLERAKEILPIPMMTTA